MTNVFTKDPDATLDYQWNWAAWLEVGETITTANVTVPDGITLDSSTHADTTVTAWLSGGKAGKGYKVLCHIETNAGREDDRSIYIRVQDR